MYAVVVLAALLLTLSPAHARALLLAALPQPVPAQPWLAAAPGDTEYSAELSAPVRTARRSCAAAARPVIWVARQAIAPGASRTRLLPGSPNAP